MLMMQKLKFIIKSNYINLPLMYITISCIDTYEYDTEPGIQDFSHHSTGKHISSPAKPAEQIRSTGKHTISTVWNLFLFFNNNLNSFGRMCGGFEWKLYVSQVEKEKLLILSHHMYGSIYIVWCLCRCTHMYHLSVTITMFTKMFIYERFMMGVRVSLYFMVCT